MFTIKDLEKAMGYTVQCMGDPAQIAFDNVKSVEEANQHSLCWIAERNSESTTLFETCKANTIICSNKFQYHTFPNKVLIPVENPRLSFLQIVRSLFTKPIEFGIHPTAQIHKEARLSDKISIGPFSVIGNCSIGENVVIESNCHIHDDVIIGNHVHIMSNTNIGGNGFGYERNDKKEFEFFPHVGTVIIEDHVDIGANTCIDRGTLGATHIKSGSKIDNLVHIAHNVVIGRHCAVIAHAMIGGGTTIGDYCWIAPNAVLRDGLKIGDHAVVGIGALVLKDIPAGETWIGSPAKKYK
jgi:UDP-3-O-[3-hydroxymyristoyl] glucosamine N-acyltransferase